LVNKKNFGTNIPLHFTPVSSSYGTEILYSLLYRHLVHLPAPSYS